MSDVTLAFQRMQNQKKINILKSFGAFEDEIKKGDTELSPEKQEIIKALSSDNPFEQEYGRDLLEKSDMSEIEKSDIMDAISYGGGNSNFGIKKTGKEIKEQIKNVILPTKQAELATKKSEADNLLAECGTAPTKDVCRWWTNNMRLGIGYKVYDWEECRMKPQGDYVCDSISWEEDSKTPKCNCCETEEQCKARRDYNETVEIICRILVDIKACDILTKNLKDEDNITLTPQQLVVFQFD